MPKSSCSLFVKFAVFILLLFGGISLFLGVSFWYAEKKENRRDAQLIGETILGNLVQLIQLQGMDSQWLQPYLVGVGSGPNIHEICVCDAEGIVQVATNFEEKGQFCRFALQREERGSRLANLIVEESPQKDVLRIIQRIPSINPDNPPLGSAVIEIDLGGKFLFTLWENQGALLFLILSLLFLLIALYVFIHFTVVSRLRVLQQGAYRIARGDFSTQLQSASADEFDILADSFNFMTKTLNETVVSMNYFNSVIRSVGDTLFVLDSKGRVKLMNQAGLRMLGYNEEEIYQRHALDLFAHPDDILPAAEKGVHPMLLSQTGIELELVSREGELIPVLFSGTGIIADSDTISDYVCVAQDIRQRKKTEEEILKINQHLKHINLELQETQAQLVQSAKLASLGEMATGITHELNQPLVVISLNAEMGIKLLELNKYEEIGGVLATIVQQVKRSAKIINHLKIFGRNPDSIKETPEDINQIVQDSFILFNEQLRLRGIEVRFELTDNLPLLTCNRIQVEQVLTNLLSNARDALEESVEKNITVTTSCDEENVIIELADSGHGIDADVSEQIFDPFFTTKEIGEGTGLGMAISYGIMKKHGASLEFDSDPGKGTVFRMQFPLKKKG